MGPKSSATIFISTNLARKSTGSAKKKLNLTSTSTKPNMTRFANKLKYPNVLPNTQKHVLMRRSNIVKPLTKRNVLKNTSKSVRPSTKPPMKRNKSAQPLTKPKPPMKRNKSVKLLTPKSASQATTMKRNARKSLINLANTLMFPSMNKCLKKNATTSKFPNKCLKKSATTSKFPNKCLNKNATISMYPNATMCQSKNAVSTLCPTAKKSPMKCAKKYPKSSATIFISTNLARKSTGNAKKKLNLTSTSTKPNMTRFANKLKYSNVLPNTQKHVLMR